MEGVGRAIKKFHSTESLRYLTPEELRLLPKEFLICYATRDISDVWKKLPIELQNDPEMQLYQRCWRHNFFLGKTAFDGPVPMKKFCLKCLEDQSCAERST